MDRVLVPLGNTLFRHRNWIFPVLVALIFAIGAPPERVFGSEGLEHAKDVAALLVAVAGLGLRALVIGYRHVQRSGVNRTIDASQLHTTEMFALCRNPLYAGNLLIVVGIFAMHGNPAVFAVGVAAFLLVYVSLVRAEERYLSARFGAAYERYRATVPRWLPDLRRARAALATGRFDARRVLLVEYTNIGVTAIALTVAELYEELEEPLLPADDRYALVLTGVIGVALCWIVAVRVIKKTGLIVSS